MCEAIVSMVSGEPTVKAVTPVKGKKLAPVDVHRVVARVLQRLGVDPCGCHAALCATFSYFGAIFPSFGATFRSFGAKFP